MGWDGFGVLEVTVQELEGMKEGLKEKALVWIFWVPKV